MSDSNLNRLAALNTAASNLNEEWICWERKFKNFFLAAGYSEKPKEVHSSMIVQIAVLENLIGDDATRIKDTLTVRLNMRIMKMETTLRLF